MTRATWPLSREAVEAAARQRYDRMNRSRIMAPESQGLWHPPAWDEMEPRARHKIMQDMAEDIIAALDVWVPSEGQIATAWSKLEDDQDAMMRETLLAAVRTEAE